jgi:hypothetical protein
MLVVVRRSGEVLRRFEDISTCSMLAHTILYRRVKDMGNSKSWSVMHLVPGRASNPRVLFSYTTQSFRPDATNKCYARETWPNQDLWVNTSVVRKARILLCEGSPLTARIISSDILATWRSAAFVYDFLLLFHHSQSFFCLLSPAKPNCLVSRPFILGHMSR